MRGTRAGVRHLERREQLGQKVRVLGRVHNLDALAEVHRHLQRLRQRRLQKLFARGVEVVNHPAGYTGAVLSALVLAPGHGVH